MQTFKQSLTQVKLVVGTPDGSLQSPVTPCRHSLPSVRDPVLVLDLSLYTPYYDRSNTPCVVAMAYDMYRTRCVCSVIHCKLRSAGITTLRIVVTASCDRYEAWCSCLIIHYKKLHTIVVATARLRQQQTHGDLAATSRSLLHRLTI